jgi:hypothetical protein
MFNHIASYTSLSQSSHFNKSRLASVKPNIRQVLPPLMQEQESSPKTDREVLDEILSRIKKIEIKIDQLATDTPEADYERLVEEQNRSRSLENH